MDDIIQHADELFRDCRFQEAYDMLRVHPDVQSKFELLWRLCRTIYSLFKEVTPADGTRGNALVLEGFNYATIGLTIAPTASAAHKYYAIFLGEKSGIDGLKERVLQLSNILRHIQKAVELDSADPFAWFIQGNFYHKLASLPWYQRKFIHTITSDIPEATYEDALRYFNRAEQQQPNFLSLNDYMRGETCYQLKDYDQARRYLLVAASQSTPRTTDDWFALRESRELLKKL